MAYTNQNDGRKVGSQAISTVNFDSWIKEPIVQAPQKNKKTRGVKEIVHKCFSECAEITQDQFWVEKFNNAAIGKFPAKFSFRDGILVHKKGAKNKSLELSNNKYEAASACMEFFRVNGGIFSPTDEQNSIALQCARTQDNSAPQLTWTTANKKLQECLISYYIMNMKHVMGLKNAEVEQLRQSILLGIFNKFFGKHNIRLEDNHIYSIEGLLWNDDTRTFFIDSRLKPVMARKYARKTDGGIIIDSNQKDTVPQFLRNWMKYVDFLDKKVCKVDKQRTSITIHQSNTAIPAHMYVNTSTKDTSLPDEPETESDDDDDDDDE